MTLKLKAKILGLEAGGKPIVILHHDDAADLGVRSLSRVKLRYRGNEATAIVNTTTRVIGHGNIGISEEVKDILKLRQDAEVFVDIAKFPQSLQYIINRLKGRRLVYEEIREIINDVVQGNLNEIEIAAFVTALNQYGLDLDEAANLSNAMVETGDRLQLNKKTIVDKHSVGGVPGDKTTLLVVPIVASAGLTIPKTSSRAITSAAGSADRAESLMEVNLDINEMKNVVEKANGCFVWGGSLRMSPADDIFIQVEFPLSIDPMLLPSIMSKKKAVGANFVVIDIPTGRGTKIKTIGDANLLAKDFITIGKKLGMNVQCAVTFGEQPIGHAIGPALEAREALEVLMRKKNVPDLIDKASHIAGILFGMTGIKNGEQVARDIIKSGKAEAKLREIIGLQSGNPKVKPEDLEIGQHGLDYESKNSGVVLWIDNASLVEIARAAGSPNDKGAGIVLYKKLGDHVTKGEKLFTVYAEKQQKLERVRQLMEEDEIMGVGDRMEMLMSHVKEFQVHKKTFILER